MTNETMLGYYVFDGRKWLADDEKSWTDDFYEAASFSNAELAKEIGEREEGDRVIYILGCLPS